MYKLKTFKNTLSEIYFQFYDFLFIFFLKLIKTIKKEKTINNRTKILTASDNDYFPKLINLLKSIYLYEKNSETCVIDLGLSKENLNILRTEFKNTQIKLFKFNNYPDFFRKRDEFNKLGSYAWKGTSVFNEYKEDNSKIKYLLWLDAGCVLLGSLDNARLILDVVGFYSPYSEKKIHQFTHPVTLNKFSLSSKILSRKNLSSGVVGFNVHNTKAINIIEKWNEYSQIKDIISPQGSSRTNHRQDQSVLTILGNLEFERYKLLKRFSTINIKIHQPSSPLAYFTKNEKFDRLSIYKNLYLYSTNNIKACSIIWLLEINDIKKIRKKYLKNKFVICNWAIDEAQNKKIYENKINKYINFFILPGKFELLTSSNKNFEKIIFENFQ